MKNHWLKKYRQQKLIEDAIEIYHLSIEKVKEIPLGMKFNLNAQRHLPKKEWYDRQKPLVVFHHDTGAPIFTEDLDMSHERLSHPHNWMEVHDV